MDAQTFSAGVVLGGLVIGGTWRGWTWRQEHATLVKVQVDLGIVQVWPAVKGAIILTVYNGSAHQVRVTGAAIETNSGPHGVLAQIALPPLAGIPGVIGPHDSAMTWWDKDELEGNAFDLTRPLRGRISLAERDGFIWSKRKQLLKKS
jgi:hypothetical protein